MRLLLASACCLFLGSILACGQSTREVTVSTLFPVRPDLANGLLAPDPSLAGPLDSVGAAGLPLNKCLQTGLRVQFIDQRPGYPPFTARLNLVTNLTNNINWSSGSVPGPKGLIDAMNWLENNAFIPRTIVIPVPKDSGGTIRIQGSFVQPIERDPVTGECKRFDPNLAPYQTYTIYGDAPLKIGGPPTVKLLVNVYGAQVADANSNIYGFGTYSIPSLVGNQINHPSGNDANRILCRDLTRKESCMNRGLLEFRIKAPFFSSSTKLGINYGSDPGADRVYQSILVPYATGIDVYAYLPRNPYFQLNYVLPGQPVRKPTVEIDWINKRYRFSSDSVFFETSMVPNCQSPGYFGLLIPASSVPDTNAAASPTCIGSGPTSANFFIKDLGAGFY